jgi:hypothetical protein
MAQPRGVPWETLAFLGAHRIPPLNGPRKDKMHSFQDKAEMTEGAKITSGLSLGYPDG